MTAQTLAICMFPLLFVLFLLGYQITFSLMATGIIFGFIGIYLDFMSFASFLAIPDNLWGRIMANDTLLAIPFFTLMGLILERSGMAEDLLEAIAKLFGKIRGGLAYAVIFVGVILAATTGIVAASVMTMGLIALPIMLRYGYDRKIACGVIAASGTLAQIVPPSLVLIVLADQLGKSVGDMYEAAFIPSMLLVVCYCLYVFGMTLLYPKSLPAGDSSFENCHHSQVVYGFLPLMALCGYVLLILFVPTALPFKIVSPEIDSVLFVGFAAVISVVYLCVVRHYNAVVARHVTFIMRAIVPPVILIFLVLGTIFQGIATPTEAGAAGATGAIILSFMRKKLTVSLTKEAIEKTINLACFVMFILIGARIFTSTFYNLEGHHAIESLFLNLPFGAIGFLVIVNIMIFFLAFFLDFFELAFIVVPLLAPVATKLGIDLIWFGVILGLNLQTSFMHPPFGFSLFFLRSVAPKEAYKDSVTQQMIEPITTVQIYKGAIPFVCMQLLVVALVIVFPNLAQVEKKSEGDLDLILKQRPILEPLKEPLIFL
jgi:TRAP-type mannitol/chloroaromatic compound transport system permease large subunit